MIKGFRCDFCDVFLQTEKEMEEHEQNCHDNPKNRTCSTCFHADFSGDGNNWPDCTVNSKNFIPTRWKVKCEDWQCLGEKRKASIKIQQ